MAMDMMNLDSEEQSLSTHSQPYSSSDNQVLPQIKLFCSIPAKNLRLFSKMIQSLGRIGEDLYLEGHADKVNPEKITQSHIFAF